MTHHDINNDNDLKSIFCKPAKLQVKDTISINHQDLGIKNIAVKQVAPGNSGQAYVIELDNGNWLQKYSCPINNKDLILIFKDALPAQSTTVIYSI